MKFIFYCTLAIVFVGINLYHCEGSEQIDQKENDKEKIKYNRKISVLTLPIKIDTKVCFPQKFVPVSASSSQVNLEELAQHPDRKVVVSDERIIISFNGKYGFCDSKGVILVEPKYDFLEPFSEGLAIVREDGKYGYLNVNGEYIVKPKLGWAYSFYNGLGAVEQEGLWGLIDKHGEWVKKPSFRRIVLLKGGLHAVTADGTEGFLDKNGNIIKK